MSNFQDKIQSKIYKGFNKAAQRLGSQYVQYRPSSSGAVIAQNNIVQEIFFAFDKSPNFDFKQPLDYNQATYYALVDLTEVQIGDYFWDYNNRTFFVANIEPLKPAEVVLCNVTIDLLRPASSTTNGYGGDTTPQTLLTGWPASILPGTKGEMNEAKTPGTNRSFWVQMRIPYYVSIDPYDIVTDNLGRRFVVSDNSLAKEGYFCTMSYEGA